MPTADAEAAAAAEAGLGLTFRDPSLLLLALTHTSYAHENGLPGSDNERLEFLGDAVLHLLAARFLFHRDVDAPEGRLTTARAALVSTGALAATARAAGLGRHLRLGRGVDRGGGRELDSLLANSLEAVFGAVFLDRGMAAAERFFASTVAVSGAIEANHKGRLQELTQGEGRGVPTYVVVDESGPAHRRRHRVEVTLEGLVIGQGEGPTRRVAEQAAAAAALLEMHTL
ncbi:MAG: ribonuclease III [Candidatus Dormibacteria bacterium]